MFTHGILPNFNLLLQCPAVIWALGWNVTQQCDQHCTASILSEAWPGLFDLPANFRTSPASFGTRWRLCGIRVQWNLLTVIDGGVFVKGRIMITCRCYWRWKTYFSAFTKVYIQTGSTGSSCCAVIIEIPIYNILNWIWASKPYFNITRKLLWYRSVDPDKLHRVNRIDIKEMAAFRCLAIEFKVRLVFALNF